MSDKPAASDLYIGRVEACSLLNVSKESFFALVDRGLIGVYAPPSGRPRYIRADVAKIVAESFKPAST